MICIELTIAYSLYNDVFSGMYWVYFIVDYVLQNAIYNGGYNVTVFSKSQKQVTRQQVNLYCSLVSIKHTPNIVKTYLARFVFCITFGIIYSATGTHLYWNN